MGEFMIKSKPLTTLLASQLSERKTIMHKKFLRTYAGVVALALASVHASTSNLKGMDQDKKFDALESVRDIVKGFEGLFQGHFPSHEKIANQMKEEENRRAYSRRMNQKHDKPYDVYFF